MPVSRPQTNNQAEDHPFCNSAGCKAKWGDTFKSERQAEPSFICGKCLKLAADEEKKNEQIGQIEQIEQIEQNESYDTEFYIIWFVILGLVLAFFI